MADQPTIKKVVFEAIKFIFFAIHMIGCVNILFAICENGNGSCILKMEFVLKTHWANDADEGCDEEKDLNIF